MPQSASSLKKRSTSHLRTESDSRFKRVIGNIETMIISRQLRPGDRLPSERDLAETFKVSRTLVREAIHHLVARSLLEVKPGSGVVVRIPSRQAVVQSVATFFHVGYPQLDPRKIFEVRRVLEVEVAAIAAERRTLEDLARLESVLEEMSRIKDQAEAFAKRDVNFHSILAQATHNELFIIMNESIYDILYEVRQVGGRIPGSREKAIKFHENIYKKVRVSDVEGARKAMLDHLIDAEKTFTKGLATTLKSFV